MLANLGTGVLILYGIWLAAAALLFLGIFIRAIPDLLVDAVEGAVRVSAKVARPSALPEQVALWEDNAVTWCVVAFFFALFAVPMYFVHISTL